MKSQKERIYMKEYSFFMPSAALGAVVLPIALTVSCTSQKIEATWETGGYVYEGSFIWHRDEKPTESDIAKEIEKNSHVKYVKILSWNFA